MSKRNITLWILSVSLLPLFLGGDLERWLQGTVFCCMGVLFLLSPPRRPCGGGIGWVALALFAVSLTAFLPARWFGLPAWRVEVTEELGIALPGTLSPQPWLSVDYILLLGAGLLWIYYLAARGWSREERPFAMRTLAACLLGFTLASFAGYFAQWTPPLWQGERYFGPIANRNQMAIALCITALGLLGCANYEFQRKHRYRALLWAAGIPLVFAGLVVNYSRAGILLFFIGLGLWIATTAVQKRSAGLFAGAGSLLLFFVAIFLLYGGRTLDRFTPRGSDLASEARAEGRFEIFENSLNIIVEAPVFGIGFGNFAPVYALHYQPGRDTIVARVAQPENDLLWLATETGLAGFFLAIVFLAMLAKRAFPLRSGRSRRGSSTSPLRVSALICAVLFLIDGFVNIPGHRMAVALLGLLLFSLSFRSTRHSRSSHSSHTLAVVYRLGGLAMLAAGITWIAATFLKLPLPGTIGVENLTDKALEAQGEERYDEALRYIDRAIQIEPLRYRHYFKRAVYAAERGLPLERAVADFSVSHKLEPAHPIMPLGEAEFWLEMRPAFAAQALEEAMRRSPGAAASHFYRFALRSGIDPLFQRALADLAFEDPAFQIMFFYAVPNEVIARQLERIATEDPELEEWNRAQKKILFKYWEQLGDKENLISEILKRPDWEEDGWEQLCRHFGAAGDFQRAVEMASRHLNAPALPRFNERQRLEDLRRTFATNPEDVSAGIRLYNAETQLGNDDEALVALEKVVQVPDCPDYAFYLLARAYEKKGEFEAAWKSLETFMRKQPPA